MTRVVLVFWLLASAAAFAESSDDLFREERDLIAKLAQYPEQILVPIPNDPALPYLEYFRYQDRLYKKLYSEGQNGRAVVTEYLCTNENLDSWQEKEPVLEDLKKIQNYVANARLQNRVEIQNKRTQLLIQIDSIQKREVQKQTEENVNKGTVTDVYDQNGQAILHTITTPTH